MRLKYWIGLSFMFGVMILFWARYYYNPDNQSRRVHRYFIDQLENEKATISSYQVKKDISILSSIKDSPFYIEIFQGDSLVFWNNSRVIQSKNLSPVAEIGASLFKAKIFLAFNTLNQISTQEYTLSPSNSTEGYRIGSKNFNIVSHKPIFYRWSISLAWLSIFLAWVFVTIVYRSFLRGNLLWAFVVFGGFKLLHEIIAFRSLFNGSILLKRVDTKTVFYLSFADTLIYIWIVIAVSYLISESANYKRLSALVRKWPQSSWFYIGAITSILFGFWSATAHYFVTSDVVRFETNDLLGLGFASMALVFILSIIAFVVFHLTFKGFEILKCSRISDAKPYIILITSIVSTSLIMYATGLLKVSPWMFIAYVLAYSLIMDAYVDSKSPRVTYLIWWIIMFAGFISINIYHHGILRDNINRINFVKSIYQTADKTLVKDLENIQDTLINSSIFTKISSISLPAKVDSKDLEQYIFNKIKHQPSHLHRSIEFFDSNGNTLFSNHFANYNKTQTLWQNAENVGKNIYYNPFEFKYIMRLEIAQSDVTKSWILFIIYHDASSQELKESRPKYNYIIYGPQNIIERKHYTADPSVNPLNIASLEKTTVKDGYLYAVHRPNNIYKIISYRKSEGLIKPISMFSMVFTFLGLMTLILSALNTRIEFLPENLPLKFGSRSSLKSKIQLAIIFLILFTFFVIGTITIYYFKNLIHATQLSNHRAEATTLIQNISSDVSNMEAEAAVSFLQTKINEYQYIHDKDLALYNTKGQIMVTNHDDRWPQRMPMNYLEPEQTNKGQKNYDFIPLYIDNDELYAFLGVGHRSTELSSNSILDFLTTILNAYIFLFLIAGAIAITIANSITQPLSYLTEKLKKFKLGQSNDALEWQSNDEIGTLIDDYNNLTREVDRSANILAKTQRDMAWREMAKQVAHEIKNPLTPIKLNIQYLERATKEDPTKAGEMIARISSTLIEQIDNLAQIANEFSNFATMPKASNEKIILNEIVEAVHDLFRKRDDMDISLSEPIDDLIVFADRNHLVRILNNLLKNAIQAIPDGRRGKIEISLKRNGNNALIAVKDNGVGIPDEMREKVFTPNFTTKSSGTGLGLAISANMIESFNGRIYFEPNAGEGTSFFISIPLMKLEDYIEETNGEDDSNIDSSAQRVSLDD
jgi:signal transduction histidine kinase